MKLISLAISCCLLLCIVGIVQATELTPSTIQISLTGGDTKNITINVSGNEIIYLIHKILPDDEGINVTYPSHVNPLETSSFTMTISVAINIAPGNYTITLGYIYVPWDEQTENKGGKKDDYHPPVYPDEDEDKDVYPIIYPKSDKPNTIFLRPPSDGTSGNWFYFLLVMLMSFASVALIMVLYLKKFKKEKK